MESLPFYSFLCAASQCAVEKGKKGTLKMMAAGCYTGGNRPVCLEARGRVVCKRRER